ncbi:MAG: hypothetical protein H6738_04145 [Alphaproteobacteria bacterium]|nr:hypothetical protein [Alphaproteobacteria bacterium]MCB9695962.1 hypothetical protein [Alphaproteobacteria bacterium]
MWDEALAVPNAKRWQDDRWGVPERAFADGVLGLYDLALHVGLTSLDARWETYQGKK